MSDSTSSLRRQIVGASDLHAVVRTMKAIAASSIGQYDNAVRALDDYYRTVQLGLSVCLRQRGGDAEFELGPLPAAPTVAIVFGSDQGLVGQFNATMVDFVIRTLNDLPGQQSLWAIGERMQARLAETLAETLAACGPGFKLPNSIRAIAPLVGQILIQIEKHGEQCQPAQVLLFHQRPLSGAQYAPVCQRLLPLDQRWRHELQAIDWPGKNLPEIMHDKDSCLQALLREFLFVSLFRACAESLASENASRLAAMQRAEKNIDELLNDLNRSFHQLRQSGIDEELFDLVAGFEAVSKS